LLFFTKQRGKREGLGHLNVRERSNSYTGRQYCDDKPQDDGNTDEEKVDPAKKPELREQFTETLTWNCG
jgi:hypothetical protein